MGIYATGPIEPLTADEIESMVQALDADPLFSLCPYTEGEANLIRVFVATLHAQPIDVERLAEILAGHRDRDGRYIPPLTGDPVRLMGPREFARDIAEAYARRGDPA